MVTISAYLLQEVCTHCLAPKKEQIDNLTLNSTTSQDPELKCKTVKALDVPGMVSIKSTTFVRISKLYQPAQATAASTSVRTPRESASQRALNVTKS